MCGTPLPFSCPLQAPRPQATQVTHSPLRFAAALSRCVLLCDFLPAWWMDTVVECVPNTCLGALQRCDAVCVGAPPPGYPPAGYPGYPPAGYPAPGPAPGVCSAACLRWGGGLCVAASHLHRASLCLDLCVAVDAPACCRCVCCARCTLSLRSVYARRVRVPARPCTRVPCPWSLRCAPRYCAHHTHSLMPLSHSVTVEHALPLDTPACICHPLPHVLVCHSRPHGLACPLMQPPFPLALAKSMRSCRCQLTSSLYHLCPCICYTPIAPTPARTLPTHLRTHIRLPLRSTWFVASHFALTTSTQPWRVLFYPLLLHK